MKAPPKNKWSYNPRDFREAFSSSRQGKTFLDALAADEVRSKSAKMLPGRGRFTSMTSCSETRIWGSCSELWSGLLRPRGDIEAD